MMEQGGWGFKRSKAKRRLAVLMTDDLMTDDGVLAQYPFKRDYRHKALNISPAVLRIEIEGIYFTTTITLLPKETDNTSGGGVVIQMHAYDGEDVSASLRHCVTAVSLLLLSRATLATFYDTYTAPHSTRIEYRDLLIHN
jgi:hypothetical protein